MLKPFVVLAYLLVPGQELDRTLVAEFDTAAACNAFYLAKDFAPNKPDNTWYECRDRNPETGELRARSAGNGGVIRPPKLFREPDVIILNRYEIE